MVAVYHNNNPKNVRQLLLVVFLQDLAIRNKKRKKSDENLVWN